jgi:hypothetical protein
LAAWWSCRLKCQFLWISNKTKQRSVKRNTLHLSQILKLAILYFSPARSCSLVALYLHFLIYIPSDQRCSTAHVAYAITVYFFVTVVSVQELPLIPWHQWAHQLQVSLYTLVFFSCIYSLYNVISFVVI